MNSCRVPASGGPDFWSLPDSTRDTNMTAEQKEALQAGAIGTKRDWLGKDLLLMSKETYDLLDSYLHNDRSREPAVVAIAGSSSGLQQQQASWVQEDSHFLRYPPKTCKRDNKNAQEPSQVEGLNLRSDRSYFMSERHKALGYAMANLRSIEGQLTVKESARDMALAVGGTVHDLMRRSLEDLESRREKAKEKVREAKEDLMMTVSAYENALEDLEPSGTHARGGQVDTRANGTSQEGDTAEDDGHNVGAAGGGAAAGGAQSATRAAGGDGVADGVGGAAGAGGGGGGGAVGGAAGAAGGGGAQSVAGAGAGGAAGCSMPATAAAGRIESAAGDSNGGGSGVAEGQRYDGIGSSEDGQRESEAAKNARLSLFHYFDRLVQGEDLPEGVICPATQL
ncbi:hypothetical protein DUNSADRAFT_2823 [Dunaliella salina]|uniref:Uncharacterized protein n=1 Tax=Dunaliella salina TaxID=3046 RepID=A0ABQ7FWC8_DUNSA|nr:hypothetical protein DUNSADRAFT_2823 [Dunaliella salina]|eukprot:KAF5826527.1 hypothetical protein DUNSADRAFT_2823 [Dunaliella salina]